MLRPSVAVLRPSVAVLRPPRSHHTPRLTQRLSQPRAGAVREPPLLRCAQGGQGLSDPAAPQPSATLNPSLDSG